IHTASAPWTYSVSLRSKWSGSEQWIHEHDGAIRVHLGPVRGRVSVLALDSTGRMIEEVIVDSNEAGSPVDLLAVPLAACSEIVFRNARSDGAPSQVVVTGVECIDLGAGEVGDTVSSPPDLMLRPIEGWSRYYGGGKTVPERVRAARYARFDGVKWMPWLEELDVQIRPHDDLSRALY